MYTLVNRRYQEFSKEGVDKLVMTHSLVAGNPDLDSHNSAIIST